MKKDKKRWNEDLPDSSQIDKQFKIDQEYRDSQNNEPSTWYIDFKTIASIFRWFKSKKNTN